MGSILSSIWNGLSFAGLWVLNTILRTGQDSKHVWKSTFLPLVKVAGVVAVIAVVIKSGVAGLEVFFWILMATAVAILWKRRYEPATVKPKQDNGSDEEDKHENGEHGENPQPAPNRLIIFILLLIACIVFSVLAGKLVGILLWMVFPAKVATWVARFLVPTISSITMFVSCGIVVLTSLRKIPAEPLHIGIVTFLESRTTTVAENGWRIFPLYPFLLGYILVDMTKKEHDVPPAEAITPDNGGVTAKFSYTIVPDRERILNWVTAGSEKGVENILDDVLTASYRERVSNALKTPKTLPEALKMSPVFLATIVAGIIERTHEGRRGEVVTVDTSAGSIKVKKLSDDEVEFQVEGEALKILKRLRPEQEIVWKQRLDEDGVVIAITHIAIVDAKDSVKKIVDSLNQGNGMLRVPDLGAILERVNVTNVRATDPDVWAALQRVTIENAEARAEMREFRGVRKRAQKLIHDKVAPEAAYTYVALQQGKTTQTTTNQHYSIDPQILSLGQAIVAAIERLVRRP